jgi:hypothetical protein
MAELAFAVQGQSYGPMFDEKLTVADWKTKQSWAIISTKDRMLPRQWRNRPRGEWAR